jgi:hypothetical protein
VGLRPTVEDCVKWIRKSGRHVEVLIVNDGSTDKTAEVADALARENPDIVRAHHIQKNAGQFNAIRTAWGLISTTYYAAIPGDNQFDMSSFDMFVPEIGKYDVIFGFPNNEEVRGRTRNILSHFWRIYLLAFFGVSVVYLGGLVVLPVKLVRELKIESDGYLGWYELMVRLCMTGARWIQIPFTMRDREGGTSGAFKPVRNLIDLAKMTRLWTRIKGPGMLPAGEEWQRGRELFRRFKAESKSEHP